MDKRLFSRINNRILNYRKDVVRLQTELTAIPAIGPENGGEGETKKAEYIEQLLNKTHADTLFRIDAPDNRVPSGYRPNIIMKVNGKSSDRTIWIMSHMDIVPPGDLKAWKSDPFKVIEKNGKLYGRGTEDNQQGFVSSFLALKALREENILPFYDVGLVIVSDEETGSKYGIQHVLKNRSDLFKNEDLIIIPDAGDPDGVLIEIAEKSILWIKWEIKGKQTHGSTPEKGINASKAAAFFIVRMNKLYDSFNHKDPIFYPPISTFEPTKKESNVDNINTIPGVDIGYFDCRVLPKYRLDDIICTIHSIASEIEKEFGVKVTLTYPQKELAPAPTPPNTPVARAIKKAVKEVLEKEAKTVGIGGGTVAAYFREKGLPAVCWCTLDDTLHAPNEYCVIDNVLTDARIFSHIFLQD